MVLRQEQIREALGDLEAVFFDPGCLGDCTPRDAAESLASEFVGPYRDDEITRRLEAFALAERSGQLKVAARHLKAVRRKLLERLGLAASVSLPLIPDAEAKRLAAAARSGAAKVQVAGRHNRSDSSRTAEVG